MSILAWLVLGLTSGFIASLLFGGGRGGLLKYLALGLGGAVVGGAAFHIVGQTGVTGLNLWSVVVSLLGAIAILFVYHAVARRSPRLR